MEYDLFGCGQPVEDGDIRLMDRICESSGLNRARRGTLFIGHITDIPRRVQTCLARLIKDNEAELVSRDGRTCR